MSQEDAEYLEKRKKETLIITKKTLEENFAKLYHDDELPDALQRARFTIKEVDSSKTQSWQSSAASSEQPLSSSEDLFTTAGKTFQVEFTKEDGAKSTATLGTIKEKGGETSAIYSDDAEAGFALAKASGWSGTCINEESPQAQKLIELCKADGFPYVIKTKSGEIIQPQESSPSPS